MKVHRIFIALHALTCEIPVAADASSSARLAEIGVGCPSFGGQRTAASPRKRKSSFRPTVRTLVTEEPNDKSASFSQGQESLASLALSIHTVSSSLGRAAYDFSLGMLPYPNTKHGCLPRARPNPSFKRTCLRHAA